MVYKVLDAIRTQMANRFAWAGMMGEAFRITPEPTLASGGYALDDGDQFILQIVPTEESGTLHFEPPKIDPEANARVDIYENAVPADEVMDTNDDLFIHNQRYDAGEEDKEVPDATIRRISSGQLDTTEADQTEHRVIRSGRQYDPTDSDRTIWRTVPLGDNISIVVEDQSGGTGNALDFALVLYEGNRLPD